MLCYRIAGELMPGADEHLHVVNAPVVTGGAALTLCGWVDVHYTEEDGVPDCPDCLTIVRYCRSLRLPRARP